MDLLRAPPPPANSGRVQAFVTNIGRLPKLQYWVRVRGILEDSGRRGGPRGGRQDASWLHRLAKLRAILGQEFA